MFRTFAFVIVDFFLFCYWLVAFLYKKFYKACEVYAFLLVFILSAFTCGLRLGSRRSEISKLQLTSKTLQHFYKNFYKNITLKHLHWLRWEYHSRDLTSNVVTLSNVCVDDSASSVWMKKLNGHVSNVNLEQFISLLTIFRLRKLMYCYVMFVIFYYYFLELMFVGLW